MFDCLVGIIDGLGNTLLYDHTIPYDVDFKDFLESLQVESFYPLFKIHDESDYANWAKRLDFLSADKADIAKLETLIEQHKNTDYEKLAEWLWVCEDSNGSFSGKLITGEKEFKAFMALAKMKELGGKGCLMRVSESKFREITAALKYLEVQEDRHGLEMCEEGFREMERRQKLQAQNEVTKINVDYDGITGRALVDDDALDWGSESEGDLKP